MACGFASALRSIGTIYGLVDRNLKGYLVWAFELLPGQNVLG